MPRIKLDLPKNFHFTTEIPLRISDINYGGHLGNDSVLSILHESRVRFLMEHGYSEFNVENDNSVAGVRGTEFLISETKDMKKKYDDSDVEPGIYVNDGSVEAENKKNPSQKESLSAGQEVVTKGGEFKTGILEEHIKQKMEIFKTLDVMKEENYKMLREQNKKTRSMMDDILKGKNN